MQTYWLVTKGKSIDECDRNKTKFTPILLRPTSYSMRSLTDAVRSEIETRALLFVRGDASPLEVLRGVASKYATETALDLWVCEVTLHSSWGDVPSGDSWAMRWTLRQDGVDDLQPWQGPADGVIPEGYQITRWVKEPFPLEIID